MAITFTQEENKQKNLLLIFLALILIIFLIFYFGYLKKEKISFFKGSEISPSNLPRKFEINFEVLKNPILKKLQIFEKIEPVKPEEVGRENPFLPY